METEKQGKSISYTQFSMWTECPFRWKLNYIDRLGERSQNISSLFGTAMHETIQEYISTMFAQSIDAADQMDLPKLLMERMKANFTEISDDGTKHDITKDQMVEFFDDGVAILDWLVSHRNEYFRKRGYELVGIEVPLDYQVKDGIRFTGYLDIVIRDTTLNRYKIYDIKTSMQGWNKYQKKDKRKLMQLVLYKTFYSMQFGVDPKDIDVEFIIVKRKLFENADFPQKRIQRIEPASGTITQHEVLKQLQLFVNSCFTDMGEYNVDGEYPKYPSQKACRYCEFKDKPDICDRNKRKRKQ